MNNPFDFFEEIYCINLDHRTDRWEECKKEFEKLGILDRVERFSAIKHRDGRIGIIKSNLKIVQMTKRKGLKNVLVFEDDVQFLHDKNPLEVLSKAIEQIPDDMNWELFYLGANTHTKLHKMTDNLVRLTNAFAVHSMAYNSSVYDKFIKYAQHTNKINQQIDILDVWLSSEVQNKSICLMTNPLLTTQRGSFSDIENREVNYEFIEERFNNNIK